MRPSINSNPPRSITPRHGYQSGNQPNNQSVTPTAGQRQSFNPPNNQTYNQSNNQTFNQSNQQSNNLSNNQYENSGRYASPSHPRYNQSNQQSSHQHTQSQSHQQYNPNNQPAHQSHGRSNPAPSPPARPVPTPRSMHRSIDQSFHQSNNQSHNRNDQFSPPASPLPDSPDSGQSFDQSFNTKSYARSNRQPINQSNNQSTDQSDDYSPKRKPISFYTIPILSLVFLGMLILVLQSIYQSLSASRSQSTDPSTYQPRLYPLRPLYPTQWVASSLQISDVTPPKVDFGALLTHLATAYKRLPFCPPDILSSGDVSLVSESRKIDGKGIVDWAIDRLIDNKPVERLVDDELDDMIDRLVDDLFDPDDVWPPIEESIDQSVNQHYRTINVFYQPDATPYEMRLIAVPGNDQTIVRLVDQGAQSNNQSNNPSSDQSVQPSTNPSSNQQRVTPGVKLDKAAYMAADAVEWSEEEKAEMRSKFAVLSFNQNLRSSVIWQPEPHTLTISKDFPPPTKTGTQYLFGDEYVFIVLTDKKNHGLVRKSMASWGQYVKRWQIYSDFYDSKLNTTVLTNPLPSAIPRDSKNQPWRVGQFISHLAGSQNLHAQFYVVIDQFSFPLLDQLKWRFDHWLGIWSHTFPSVIGGRPDKKPAKLSYWPDHQDMVSKLFSEPLQVLPKYAYGFDHTTLMQLRYYTPVDVCPVLLDDMLTLSALMACAGGVSVEKHFLAMTRSSHREKGIVGDAIESWRLLDMFSGERTAGMVEEAFNWYYGGLAKLGPVVTKSANATRSAFDVTPETPPVPKSKSTPDEAK